VLRGNLVLERSYCCAYPRPPSRRPYKRCRGRIMLSFVISFVSFLCYSLVGIMSSWDRSGRRTKGSLQCTASRGQRTGNPDKKGAAIV